MRGRANAPAPTGASGGVTAGSDADDFAKWIAADWPIVDLIVARMCPPLDRADVLQDVMTLAWTRQGQFDTSRGSVRTWLAAIAINESRKYWRGHARGAVPVDLHVTTPSETSALRLDVEQALRRLAPRQREAIYLYYYVGLSIDEIGRAMGRSPGTVKSNLFDGRKRLVQLLGEDYPR